MLLVVLVQLAVTIFGVGVGGDVGGSADGVCFGVVVVMMLLLLLLLSFVLVVVVEAFLVLVTVSDI